jgi:iron only hydrogenase large subunit-like protein
MLYDNNNAMIRRKIYSGVAQLAMDDRLEGGLEELAEGLVPGISKILRGKDPSTARRLVKYRLSSALGIGFNNDASYYEMAKEANAEGGPAGPLIATLDGACSHAGSDAHPCEAACISDALTVKNDKVYIDKEKCIRCGLCVAACPTGAITDKADIVRTVKMLKDGSAPVYAVLAPAFAGQFGTNEGKVKRGLLHLGFHDVFEVALGADVITVREAEEFIKRMERGDRFMITSCCCPPFFALVEKYKPEMAYLISDSVSPMIGIGRMLKTKHPGCRVVFIGPCIAKKREAKKPELKDAVDVVLTFEETAGFLKNLHYDMSNMHKDDMCDASHDGRAYAHTGGVTAAIISSIRRLNPDIKVNVIRANGIKECRKVLNRAAVNKLNANFVEGMACIGGCVGGPGRILDPEAGKRHVDAFASEAYIKEAVSNKKAREFVKKFGHKIILHSQKN